VAARSAAVCRDAGGAPVAGAPDPHAAAATAHAAMIAASSGAVHRVAVAFISIPSFASASVSALGYGRR
jgi:hypothetical protein